MEATLDADQRQQPTSIPSAFAAVALLDLRFSESRCSCNRSLVKATASLTATVAVAVLVVGTLRVTVAVANAVAVAATMAELHGNGTVGFSFWWEQVRVRVRDRRPPLEEAKFRPFLFHYDGPKFRFELSHSEVRKADRCTECNEGKKWVSGLATTTKGW